MSRHSQRDGRAVRRHLVRHTRRAFNDKCQRSRPELVREGVEKSRLALHERLGHREVANVNNHRVPIGTFLGCKNSADGFGVERVSAESVNGFGRESDESARAQDRDGTLDCRAVRHLWIEFQDFAFHCWQDKRLCYDGRAKMKNTAILLVDCPDRKGIVAAISDFLFRHNANILHADQHQDADLGLFLTRVEWDLKGFKLAIPDFENKFALVAKKFQMRWRVEASTTRPRTAIFVSKDDHCLADLLYRHESGELDCEVPLVISNHRDAERLVAFHKIPFHVVPVVKEKKAEAEREQLALLKRQAIDLVVLARYMQVLSPEFVAQYPQRIINVHHSFLPAFSGARPYHRAFERGVKLIGATSHYVTETLDDGPIIEQDVVRISHRDQLEDLIQKGRDLEKAVLSRAVRWHIEHRVLVYAKKTVIFD